MNHELLVFKLALEKAEEPEIKLPSVGSLKKQDSSRKTSISAVLTMPKPSPPHQLIVEWCSIIRTYSNFFIFVDEHLYCFQSLATANEAITNVTVQVFVWAYALILHG